MATGTTVSDVRVRTKGFTDTEKRVTSELKGPRYKIEKEIGRGAFGVVYVARDNLLRRKVALKVMSMPEGLSQAELQHLINRFYREARAAAGLTHPNIVTIHDISKAKDRYFISMEFLEGLPLSDVIDNESPLPLARVINIADQALEALGYAHENEVIHRDIKPENIFMLDGDVVKLVDFGLARVQASTTITRSGTVMGSPGYISPEVIDGNAADSRTDVFSFGVVFYEMLTGKRPFGPDTAFESFVRIVYRIMSESPQPIGELNGDVPPELQVVVEKMLAKDPAVRYQDGGEARAAVEQATAGMDLHYDVPSAARRRRKTTSRRTADMSGAETVSGDEAAGPQDEASRTEIMRFEEYLTQEDKKKRTWRIPALITGLCLLGIAGISVLLLFVFGVFESTSAGVPNVINLEKASATKAITKAGLKVGKMEDVFAYDIWKGKVAQQKPAAGQVVPKGSSVDLKVSMGSDVAMIPNDVLGMPEQQAVDLIRTYKFQPKVKQGYSSSVPVGCVYATEPAVGLVKAAGTEVTLMVNSGNKPAQPSDSTTDKRLPARSVPSLPKPGDPVLPRRN